MMFDVFGGKKKAVFVNTGVNIDNVRDVLALADGIVIGTHFKVDGAWMKRFMDVVETLR